MRELKKGKQKLIRIETPQLSYSFETIEKLKTILFREGTTIANVLYKDHQISRK